MRAPSIYIDPHQLLSALHFHASSGVLFVFQGTGWCKNWPKVRFTSSLIQTWDKRYHEISMPLFYALVWPTQTGLPMGSANLRSQRANHRSQLRSIADVHIGETPESRVSFRKCQADSLVVRFFWKLGKQCQRSVFTTQFSCKKMQKQIRFLPQASHQSIGTPDPIATHQASLWNKISCLQIARRKSMLIKGCIAEQKDTKSSWTTFLPSILLVRIWLHYIYIIIYICGICVCVSG